jgi:hypothetical protein
MPRRFVCSNSAKLRAKHIADPLQVRASAGASAIRRGVAAIGVRIAPHLCIEFE